MYKRILRATRDDARTREAKAISFKSQSKSKLIREISEAYILVVQLAAVSIFVHLYRDIYYTRIRCCVALYKYEFEIRHNLAPFVRDLPENRPRVYRLNLSLFMRFVLVYTF